MPQVLFLTILDLQKFCVIPVLGTVNEDIAGSYLDYIWYLQVADSNNVV